MPDKDTLEQQEELVNETVEETKPADEEVVDEATTEEAVAEVEEQLQDLKSGLTQPAEAPAQPAAKADQVTKRTSNQYGRGGMAMGGPGLRKKVKAQPETQEQEQARLQRSGVHKAFPDKPFNNVGDGTSKTDVPQRRA